MEVCMYLFMQFFISCDSEDDAKACAKALAENKELHVHISVCGKDYTVHLCLKDPHKIGNYTELLRGLWNSVKNATGKQIEGFAIAYDYCGYYKIRYSGCRGGIEEVNLNGLLFDLDNDELQSLSEFIALMKS